MSNRNRIRRWIYVMEPEIFDAAKKELIVARQENPDINLDLSDMSCTKDVIIDYFRLGTKGDILDFAYSETLAQLQGAALVKNTCLLDLLYNALMPANTSFSFYEVIEEYPDTQFHIYIEYE